MLQLLIRGSKTRGACSRIRDAIRQTEAKVAQIFMPCLAENPMKIGCLLLEIQAGFCKTIEFFPFNWLHLKINICEFQCILLDHIIICKANRNMIITQTSQIYLNCKKQIAKEYGCSVSEIVEIIGLVEY